jgi:hypothetical protein
MVKEDIPGSAYLELGESKYIVVPKDDRYDVDLSGSASGTATVEVDELDASGNIMASSTISGITVTTSTEARVDIRPENLASTTISVDENADGRVDTTATTNEARKNKLKEKERKNQPTVSPGGGGGLGTALISEDNDIRDDGEVLGKNDLATNTPESTSSTTTQTQSMNPKPVISDIKNKDLQNMNKSQLREFLMQLQVKLRAILTTL